MAANSVEFGFVLVAQLVSVVAIQCLDSSQRRRRDRSGPRRGDTTGAQNTYCILKTFVIDQMIDGIVEVGNLRNVLIDEVVRADSKSLMRRVEGLTALLAIGSSVLRGSLLDLAVLDHPVDRKRFHCFE
jgi:hypothetical protein